MIRIEDILLAVNDLIITKFPGIPLTDSDVKEGFDRPSFFTTVDNVLKTDYLHNFRRDLTIVIYYFPEYKDKNKLEILSVIQNIEEIFNKSIIVNNRTIHIVDNIESNIIDKVLNVRIDVMYYDTNDSTDTEPPLMTDLEVN